MPIHVKFKITILGWLTWKEEEHFSKTGQTQIKSVISVVQLLRQFQYTKYNFFVTLFYHRTIVHHTM